MPKLIDATDRVFLFDDGSELEIPASFAPIQKMTVSGNRRVYLVHAYYGTKPSSVLVGKGYEREAVERKVGEVIDELNRL